MTVSSFKMERWMVNTTWSVGPKGKLLDCSRPHEKNNVNATTDLNSIR